MKHNKDFIFLLKNPRILLDSIITKIPRIFPDKTYLLIRYWLKMGRRLDLVNPQTYTEKLQWLKLNYHKSEYTELVDKIQVKQYVKDVIGEEFVIPTLHVWKKSEEIDETLLPDKFVIKANHYGGGSVFICKDKSNFDFKTMKIRLDKQLKTGLYWITREWPYKNVVAKLFCEPYLEDNSGELKDYKFYCFNGEVKVLLVASDRFTNHYFNYFDCNYNPIDIESASGKRNPNPPSKPENFEKMVELATILSKGMPHVRVDLYNVNGHIYFGELTFFDSSGYDDMNSEKWNRQFGDWITLPEKIV